MVIHAAAKVNLTLDVLGKREDGYHEVDMIMQSISLWDSLALEADDALSLHVQGDAPGDESDLTLRAARLLQSAYAPERGARMHLTKRIPIAAGLGGGSADAAAALHGLCHLWDLRLCADELCALGARLGADVPFCLRGGTARATGIGTALSPLPPPPPMALLVLKPCEGMLTRDVYGALHLDTPLSRPHTADALQALHAGDLPLLCRSMGNVLQSVTLPERPAAAQALALLRRAGALCAQMSGSGPSVFGIFPDEAAARRAQPTLQGSYLCLPVPHGLLLGGDPPGSGLIALGVLQ